MGRTAPRSRIATALALLAMVGGIATSASADFDPDELSEADRQLLINILEFEATNITRGLPASGASIVIVRTDTSPRICRYFRIRESDGDETAGVGCRSGQQLWDLAASEEDIPPADFEPPSAADIGSSAGRGPVLVEQGGGQYLGDPSDAEAAALEAAAAATGFDAGLPSVADFAPPMPPLRPETLAALPLPEGPGVRPQRGGEAMSPLVIEPAPPEAETPAPAIAPGIETVTAPNGRIFRIPGPVPQRVPAPEPELEPATEPEQAPVAVLTPEAEVTAGPAAETQAPAPPAEEPIEELAQGPEEAVPPAPIGPEFPLPLRRPAATGSVAAAAVATPPEPSAEAPPISVEQIPAFVPLEVPAPGRRPGG